MFLWKIIKEIAILGPTAQFGFWACGVLDIVTTWLKEENHWIFSVILIIIYICSRWYIIYLWQPYQQEKQRRLERSERKYRKKLSQHTQKTRKQ